MLVITNERLKNWQIILLYKIFKPDPHDERELLTYISGQEGMKFSFVIIARGKSAIKPVVVQEKTLNLSLLLDKFQTNYQEKQ